MYVYLPFPFFLSLQIANAHIFAGTSSTSGLAHQKFKGIYTNNQAASVMQGYLAEVLMEMAVVRIKSSPYIGVMVDESLDIATTKKLVTFCKIVHNNELKIEFCANIEVINGTAETIYTAITDWLASVGVNINKVSGFGSDGAAVMTGKRSGVGVRLQQINPRIIHIWCAAHRVALVSYWAAKKVPYLQKVQEILVNIYNFYEYSAPRYNKIRELKNVLGEQVKKFKKPTHVRWLSLQHAIDAVHSSWSALVLGLEHEVANDPSSVGGNKAKGILKEIKCFKFIATICLLRDVLETLGKLSKCFQKDIIDIHLVNSMITATKETISVLDEVDAEPATVQVLLDDIDGSGEYHGIGLECSYRDRLEHFRLRSNFSRNIIEQFDQRFPEHDMKILKDLNTILNPALLPQSRQSIVDHGHDALRHITDVYGENTINSEQTRNAFLQFKFLLNVNRHLNLQKMCMKILSEYSETFPNFASLAAILSTVPLTSVPCERGFSLQNRHVNRYTSRRSVKNCENRMLIAWAANQPDFDENETIRRASIKMNRQ